MWRDENYFYEVLKHDTILEEVFMQLGNLSVVRNKNSNFDFFKENNQPFDELMKILAEKLEKNGAVIQHYIDILIKWGLVKYVVDNEEGLNLNNGSDDKDEERLKFFKSKGLPVKDCKIVLTNGSMIMGCTGISLYRKIILYKEYEESKAKIAKELEESFTSGVNEILDPYKTEIETLKNELEKKIEDVNRELGNGIIKNIQVLSIFAGMISLLFANIMGIKEFATIGALGLAIINLSVVIALFSLLIFSKWIVIGEKVGKQEFWRCIAIIFVLSIPIILMETGLV